MESAIIQKDKIGRVDVGKFTASFPTNHIYNEATTVIDVKSIGKYGRLSVGRQSAIFKSDIRPGTKDTGITVATGKFKDIADGTSCKWEEVSKCRYIIYIALHDKALLLTFIGLCLAIIGTIIDAAYKVGETGFVLHYTNPMEDTCYQVIAMLFKILGLILAFYNSIINKK